ncbi:MAG: phosphatidylserine decarboxylase family protein [Sedimentisphaerales bacterium]|nr:phosphatidylserine decarboxylase family protein [Sedimentisphaerales bacterium]
MVIYPSTIVAAMIVHLVVVVHFFPDWAVETSWVFLTVSAVEFVLLALLVWSLSFFRNPPRAIPRDDDLLLAPADGTVRDIEIVEEAGFIGGPALRIGIFLSIFNVHINRSPCTAKIEKITYHRGKFLNAMNPLAGKVNESNDVAMVRAKPPYDRLLVRQISGAIARRIVCGARAGQQLAAGKPFGMIKFGSRTELYVPAGEYVECVARIGDKVKAGVTPLAKYRH